MTRRSRISTLLACLIVLVSFLPSPAAAQDTIEIRVWDQFTSPEESDTADAIYASFTEQNPNIEIVREVFQTDQMRQTVNTAISSGSGPDIIFYDAGAGYAGVLAEAGLLLPLDDYAAQYGWKERFTPSSVEATTINGQWMGLPLQSDLIGMFYNKTLIDQEGLTVPQTTAELITFCQQASEKGYIPLAFTNNPGWQGYHQFSMVANNMIGPAAMQQLLFQNQGRWDSPEIVQAIKTYFVDLRDAGCFSPDVNALTNDDGAAIFQSGQALMYPTGSWMVGDFTAETMPDMDVQMMPFPALEGGDGSHWVSGVGSAYYISSTSQHPDEAAQFLDFLISPDNTRIWSAEAGFFLPMSVDITGLEVSPLFASILEQLNAAATGGTQYGYNIDVIAPPQFNDAMLNGFQAILAGDKTPEEQAADLQAAWDEGWQAPAATPAT
jgi:raffinose/stachyose/melibiose transport system substrate-binding protein